MHETAIFAEFLNYSLGQPLRMEFAASEATATRARALSAFRQKVFLVDVFEGASEKAFCTLTATLPHKADGELIQRCIVPYSGKQVKVTFDVMPESHATFLLLIEAFYGQPQKMRLEFRGERDLPTRQKREVKAKGEFGQYWRAMHDSSMLNSQELREVLGCNTETSEATVWEALHNFFNVKSLSFVSPSDAAAKFEQANLPGVAAIARRLGESEGK